MSTITVDLSSLQTDSSLRTRTLHSNILQTGNEAFRYATFSATGFSGLPASASVGETYNFQINGDLSIHGVTRSVTFDATVTPVSATRLEGNASLEILWGDYGIGVFRLPEQVASVEDKVIVGLIFVAEAG
jgi:polyisoprenoid-binding protein YceI